MKKLIVFLPFLFLFLIACIFFKDFFLYQKFPIPSDTIIGLYHPFRDLYAKDYPNGIPYKNFLITDPVRQQYPWRNLAIEQIKSFELPLWNPYEMAGTPLLGNFQSAVFYPFNLILFVLPFDIGWSLLVFFQTFLAGIGMYIFLIHFRLNRWACLLGAITFSFCGFSIAWLEWGTILQTGLWLPLILLLIDKMSFSSSKISSFRFPIFNKEIIIQRYILWSILLTLSLSSSFLAGHLQAFFYVYFITIIYFISKWFVNGKSVRVLLLFILCNIFFFAITAIQWIPTLQLILQSGRNIDQNWIKEGWFIPWQHAIQFVVPDFFGNPTTLNYWGVFNYAEFVGYVGIISLIAALYALFFRRDRKTLFFGVLLCASLTFAFPTIFARLPFELNIPFLSTAQPTRLLFVIDFCLAILAGLGFDLYTKKHKKILVPIFLVGIVFIMLWFLVLMNQYPSSENLRVAKNNLLFPTVVFICSGFLLFVFILIKNKYLRNMVLFIIVLLASIDLLRFSYKFTPFTNREYLFPQTKLISFLQAQEKPFRIMTTDSIILPPNFSVMYKIESIDGYDPLYLLRYAEFIAASQRGKPDISQPLGFNRIINPNKYDTKIINMLGVKYILSFSEIKNPGYKKVFEEGETKVFENTYAIPRVLFVKNIQIANSKQRVLDILFSSSFNPYETAIIEDTNGVIQADKDYTAGIITHSSFSSNRVEVKTENKKEGFLVVFDTYYPSWHATIDGEEVPIYITNFNFKGIEVPKGKHVVIFSSSLL